MSRTRLNGAEAIAVDPAGPDARTLTADGLDLVASLAAAREELASLAGAQARLVEAEETLRAIRHGEVDALVVSTNAPGDQVFTLSSADRPYRIFVENMQEGAATLSGSGVVLFANERLGQLLGCPAAEVVARQMSEFVVEADRDRLLEAIGSATVGTTLELHLHGPDGEVAVLVGLSRLDVDQEHLTCLTFTDLTAEHRLLHEVSASQQRFEALYRGAPVPAHTWQHSPAGLVLIDLNDAAAQLTGQRAADALGTPATQFYRHDLQLLTHLTRSLTGNVVVERDTVSHLAGGQEQHLHITMVPVPPDLVVVHTQDVTESWLAERALRASEERYRTIVENAQEGISILDSHGRFTFANARTAQLLGHDVNALRGMDGSILLRPTAVPPTAHGLASQHEVTVTRPDGTTADLLVSTAPLLIAGSTDTGSLCVVSDVSVLRRADRSRAARSRKNALAFARQRDFSEALQYSLLTDPPQSKSVQIAVRYQPATHDAYVGGDWYDAFVTPSGATALVIGDVVGHDSRAAADMSQLRGLLRGVAYTTGDSPAQLLTRIEAIIEGLTLGTMATAIVMRLEHDDAAKQEGGVQLRWSNAGHPPAMLVWPDGRVEALVDEQADLLLGVDPTSRRSDHVAPLADGCTVLLYTDGLVERRDSDLGHGIAQLTDVLRGAAQLPLEQVCDEVLARLVPDENEDDVALLAVRLLVRDGTQ